MAPRLAIQYGQQPFQFINNFGIANDPYHPNNILNVFFGNTLDSLNTYEVTMARSILFIDTSVIGIGGLDKGPLLANKVYGVYVAWDPIGNNPDGAFLSSSYYHPLNPYGYNAVKLVGYVATDGSKNIIPGKWTPYGSSPYRNFNYAPKLAVLTNGTANTQTDIDLISFIPNIGGQIANFELNFTSSTPGNALTIYSDGGNFNLYAQAANIPVTAMSNIIITKEILIADVVTPVFSYSVTNSATDTATIYCNGYDFFL